MAHTGNEIARTALLSVEGASGWEEVVGEALRRVPGVADVQVTRDRAGLRIWFDPSLTSPEQFANLAEQAGYRVWVRED